MKKKLIIGAGIVLAVFLIFLIILCGGTTSNKVVKKEELITKVSGITCEVKDEENLTYELDTFTNDISFDSNIKNKNYTKATITKNENFKTLGIAFIAKSNEEFTLNISLYKNDEVLKTTSVKFEDGARVNVNLLLENSVDISSEDEFYISFAQTTDCKFVFDTIVFFFDGE